MMTKARQIATVASPNLTAQPETPKERRFTLAEAFEYEQSSASSTLDLEKALRSIAYLMTWSSHYGNERMSASLAMGLADVLEDVSDRVSRLFTFDDIHKLRGNPYEILKARGLPDGPMED